MVILQHTFLSLTYNVFRGEETFKITQKLCFICSPGCEAASQISVKNFNDYIYKVGRNKRLEIVYCKPIVGLVSLKLYIFHYTCMWHLWVVGENCVRICIHVSMCVCV